MNTDPASIDHLNNILAPQPTAWWLSASVAWAIGCLLLLVIGLLVKGFIHWQHNRSRRDALANYARLEKALQDPANRPAALAELAELLQQLALTAFPGAKVRTLSGLASFQFPVRNRPASQLNQDFSEVRATIKAQTAQGKPKEVGND